MVCVVQSEALCRLRPRVFPSLLSDELLLLIKDKTQLQRWMEIQRSRVQIPLGAQENEFFQVKKVVLTRCRCSQPLCVYARIRKTMYALIFIRSCSPCQSLVDYGNTKITSMHLYPQRWNVADQSGGGIKNGHICYHTPPNIWRNAEKKIPAVDHACNVSSL